MKSCSLCFRSSPFGPFVLLWSANGNQPKLSRIVLSRPEATSEQSFESSFSDSIHRSCAEIDEIASQIEAFLCGGDIRFSLDILRLDICKEFQQKVLRAEHAVPRGFVSTYQRIAVHLGKPSGARAVGTALANNPFPIIIPCHRAIRTDRTLGGYQGGIKMKQILLEMEGFIFDDAGRIITDNFFYSNP
jgi:methylated-DNA-[protein]-cysteine S-methyltransferase